MMVTHSHEIHAIDIVVHLDLRVEMDYWSDMSNVMMEIIIMETLVQIFVSDTFQIQAHLISCGCLDDSLSCSPISSSGNIPLTCSGFILSLSVCLLLL